MTIDDSTFVVYYNGGLTYNSVGSNFGASRPAITLKSGTQIVAGGEGTQTNPYVIQ